MYMNFSSSSGSYSDALDIQHIGVSEANTSQQEVLLNFGGSRALEHDFSSWKDGGNGMPLMHSLGEASGVLHGEPNLQSQGLSLSLSTHEPSLMQMSSIQYQNTNPNFSALLGSNPSTSGEHWGRNISIEGEDNFQTKQSTENDYMPNSDAMKTDVSPYGMPSIARAVPNSKYLKAAQHLLDEVVNVKKAIMEQRSKRESKEVNGDFGDGALDPSIAGSPSLQPEASRTSNELSVAEKQDLQSKTTKLLSMLDEVDRRYRQYHHQMQIVVSSFDMIAGSGAAKPYTALALQTISRHFRCLRDAINGHINVAQKNLGEEDSSSNDKGSVGISRLRYVDQQLRQQRVLQQLGMMQQHAWRPQRGLPESSVSILRAWLFEHFLHPYPKDSDKIMLARQTGLTRSQVSNWFINARVRLWKPMVEEMYKEEARDSKMESNSSSETIPRTEKTTDTNVTKDQREDLQWSETSLKSRCDQVPDDVEMLVSNTSSTYANAAIQPSFGSERFMYQMSELQRFGNGNGNGVSLTLGLQQCEGGSISMTNGFVSSRDDEVYTNATSGMGNEVAEFDCMGSVNEQHRLSSLQSFTRLL